MQFSKEKSVPRHSIAVEINQVHVCHQALLAPEGQGLRDHIGDTLQGTDAENQHSQEAWIQGWGHQDTAFELPRRSEGQRIEVASARIYVNYPVIHIGYPDRCSARVHETSSTSRRYKR